MKRNHNAFTQRNKLPKVERDVAEALVARKAVEILIIRNGKDVPINWVKEEL